MLTSLAKVTIKQNGLSTSAMLMKSLATIDGFGQESGVNISLIDLENGKILNSIDDEPALFIEGMMKVWAKMGKIHRTVGPAVIDFKTNQKLWFINDVDITAEFLQWATENKIDIDNITPEDEQLIIMKWSE